MRYLPVAIAVAALLLGTAHAAGPFDGRWTGSWSGVSGIGGADSHQCQLYHGDIDMTVADGQVTGSTKGQFKGTIAGTVSSDGKFSGTMASYQMTGKFSGKKFKGRFTTAKCAMNVAAKGAS